MEMGDGGHGEGCSGGLTGRLDLAHGHALSNCPASC